VGGLAGGSPRDGNLFLVDTSVADPARVYNFWLGGKDHFQSDRLAAAAGVSAFPGTVQSVRANRAFLARTVRYLAEAGIRQFIDIGAGLPSADNTHEIAQAVAPESRVLYVDNDPVVLAHAQALLTSTAAGATGYLNADVRDPEKILRDVAPLLDVAQPAAVLLLGILHYLRDDEGPHLIVDALMDAVPAGSYLVVSHLASDLYPEQIAAFARTVGEHLNLAIVPRRAGAVSRFFDRLELVEPGMVQVATWRPRTELESRAPAALWGGVARKPGRFSRR
jgi:S-adenosyl methyltransferase